jgi:hypothetical protein
MANPKKAVVKRYLRRAAAEYIEERTGAPMSDRTLERRPIPYDIVNGRASYTEPNLDIYIEHVLGGAAQRRYVGRHSRPGASSESSPV